MQQDDKIRAANKEAILYIKEEIALRKRNNTVVAKPPVTEGVFSKKKTKNEFKDIANRAKSAMITLGWIQTMAQGGNINDNQNFKNWFGNSKVIDNNGEPLVVYHGTASKFTEFTHKKAQDKTGRRMKMGWGKGKFYFVESEQIALIAGSGAKERGEGKEEPLAMPVYLKIEKPITGDEYIARLEAVLGKEQRESEVSERDKAIKKLDISLKKEGYDGIISDLGSLAVFFPTQIKSAIGNSGAFDPNNPDITMAKGGQLKADSGTANSKFLGQTEELIY